MLEVGLFWIGIILVIVAILILFLDSFQSRRIWAVISLVLIVPLLIHMLLNWSLLTIRKSFFILIIGLLAVLVSFSGGALSQLSFLQDHEVMQVLEEKIAPPKEVPLSNQQQADAAALSLGEGYDPLLTGGEYEQLETKEIVPERKNQVVRKVDPIVRYEIMTDDEHRQAINKRVRITMTDGRVIEGNLTEIFDDSLIIESNVNGGSLGLSYKNDLIQSVAVRLAAGEQLVVPKQQVIKDVVEELVEEPVVVEPSVIDAQQSITDTEVLLNNIPPQITPKSPEINSDIIIEQQSKIDVLDSSLLPTTMAPETSVKIEDEVLENVE